jgi:hypothetical protein
MSDDASWVPGFQLAVASYLVKQDRVSDQPGTAWPTMIQSPLSIHFETCSIDEVRDVEQNSAEVSVFDSFDSDASRAASYLSAAISCSCGQYQAVKVSVEGEIQEIIWGVLDAAEKIKQDK